MTLKSRMRPPGGCIQKLVLLAYQERAKITGKIHEVIIRKQAIPVIAAIGIIIKFPQMHNLMQRAGIRDEIAHQLFIKAALLQGRPALVGIGLNRIFHLADSYLLGT